MGKQNKIFFAGHSLKIHNDIIGKNIGVRFLQKSHSPLIDEEVLCRLWICWITHLRSIARIHSDNKMGVVNFFELNLSIDVVTYWSVSKCPGHVKVIYNLSESAVAGVRELSSQSQLLSLLGTQDTKDTSYV